MPEADALSKAIRLAHNDRDGHPLSPLREPPPTPAEALEIIEDSLKRCGFNWITGANARDTLRNHLSNK